MSYWKFICYGGRSPDMEVITPISFEYLTVNNNSLISIQPKISILPLDQFTENATTLKLSDSNFEKIFNFPWIDDIYIFTFVPQQTYDLSFYIVVQFHKNILPRMNK